MRLSGASYQLVQKDCFAWMEHCPAHSVHAIVTDPPYGSTIAAACAVGYESIGIESDPAFFEIAKAAIPRLAALEVNGDSKPAPGAGT